MEEWQGHPDLSAIRRLPSLHTACVLCSHLVVMQGKPCFSTGSPIGTVTPEQPDGTSLRDVLLCAMCTSLLI